ncbi:MAG: XrtA system polysaccharide chain length determinant [Betaproteobacteria bacterium]
MDELLRQTVITLRGMWHYRWLGMAIAWLVAAIGIVVIIMVPDRYEASTRIYVNTASILKPLMTGLTVLQNDDQQIAMLSKAMVSRPNVEKLVQTAGLDADVKSKPEYDKLVDGIIKSLQIQGGGRDNIYVLTFRDTKPERATRVVQQFSSMFIESGYGGKSSDTDAAKRFIDEQIAAYDKKLQEAENRLKEFKLRSLGMNTGEGKDYFARLAETSNLLERAQLDLREAENTRDAFRRGLASEEPSSVAGTPIPTVSGAMISDVEARIDAQRRNLDVLLQKYTDSHPDVIGAKRVIRELEEQRAQLLVARRKEGSPAAPMQFNGGPRASEQLKVSLAQAEATVASLRARVAEYSSRYARLKASATLVPQLEAEATQLNRDYEVNKKNYDSLVSRRESANISGEMQSVSGVADFRMIDPPRVSPGPVFPNRRVLFPLALVAALAAGFAAAFIAREVRPAFYDGRALAEITGLPILGTVSLIVNDTRKKAARRSTTKFLAAVGMLLGTYLAGFLALAFLSARAT